MRNEVQNFFDCLVTDGSTATGKQFTRRALGVELCWYGYLVRYELRFDVNGKVVPSLARHVFVERAAGACLGFVVQEWVNDGFPLNEFCHGKSHDLVSRVTYFSVPHACQFAVDHGYAVAHGTYELLAAIAFVLSAFAEDRVCAFGKSGLVGVPQVVFFDGDAVH